MSLTLLDAVGGQAHEGDGDEEGAEQDDEKDEVSSAMRER